MRSSLPSMTTNRRPHGVEPAAEQLTGPPVADEQQERLAHPGHLVRELLQGPGLAERPALEQRQQRADGVRPADHRQVDRDGHPQPLLLGERVGQLAEADGGGGVAHEVERVEQRSAGAGCRRASWPGIRVSPSTLTAKITISTISGVRIRRRIRKIVAEACTEEQRDPAAHPLGQLLVVLQQPPPEREQRIPHAATPSATVVGHGLDHQQHHRDHVGEQRAAGQRHHAGRGRPGQPLAGTARRRTSRPARPRSAAGRRPGWWPGARPRSGCGRRTSARWRSG